MPYRRDEFPKIFILALESAPVNAMRVDNPTRWAKIVAAAQRLARAHGCSLYGQPRFGYALITEAPVDGTEQQVSWWETTKAGPRFRLDTESGDFRMEC